MQPALLWEKTDCDYTVLCKLCSHYCEIKVGNYGICGVRKNIDGKLFSLSYGNSSGFAIDPIEKKPLYHFKPGSRVLSFGTPGCNFHCRNCQNWQLSQDKCKSIDSATKYTPEYIATMAQKYDFEGVAYTYSEPTIFFEYARDTVLKFREYFPVKKYFHVFVSNGFMSKESLDIIEKEKLISAINIDLKFINDNKYKKNTGGMIEPILNNIKRINELRELIHLEITNLLIPDINDDEDSIKQLTNWIANVSNEIPLHISRFFPNYKMEDKQPTAKEKLISAKSIANNEGLKFVYIGNTNLSDMSSTFCPNCNELLIKRDGYKTSIKSLEINTMKCIKCETKINIIL